MTVQEMQADLTASLGLAFGGSRATVYRRCNALRPISLCKDAVEQLRQQSVPLSEHPSNRYFGPPFTNLIKAFLSSFNPCALQRFARFQYQPFLHDRSLQNG